MAQPIEVTKNRDVPMDKIRNIGIIAHVNAGKTTTTERMLFETGRTYKLGAVDEGSTVTDWMDQERERGITIVSAAVTTFWQDHRINIIDTPGHIDFTAEVERSLRVLDGAVMVFDGRTGVEAQSETVWHQANKYNVPRICVFNKLNLVGADFDGSVESIRKRLGANAWPIQLPLGLGHDLRGAIDLIEEKAYVYESVEDNELKEIDIPDEFKDKVKEYREKLVEYVAETDEEILEKYLEGKEISIQELKDAIRQGVINNEFFPIMGGDSRTVSTQLVLDAIVRYLPSPEDLPPINGVNPETGEEEKRVCEKDQPFSALLFKVQTDPHVGKLSYLRIYSGTLEGSSQVYNATTGQRQRIGRLLLMHADKREGIDEAYAGEIVAAIGLDDSATGQTICQEDKPVVFEDIEFPEPVISIAIEPETKADQEKLSAALNKFQQEDPTFQTTVDHETGQTIISGMGELHLEILVERMRREFGLNVNTGKPQIAYREAIKKTAEAEAQYIRQSGGRGQYGHVLLRVEPRERGEGFEFESEIKGAAIPENFIPAIEKGVKEAMEKGVVAGYPLVDMKVVVFDGSYHEVDSSDMAFKIAGSMALKKAAKRANPALLEPIMTLEVTTPEDFLGQVIGDLSSRRAQILGTETRKNVRIVNALVPLAEIRGYATVIRSLTQGRGSFYMEPSHYEEMPENIKEQVVANQAV
jgi:elongation factor G